MPKVESEYKIEPYYQQRAKETTDMLFDKRFLADDLSRESIDKLQDFIAFMYQSQCESAVRVAELNARFRDSQRKKDGQQ